MMTRRTALAAIAATPIFTQAAFAASPDFFAEDGIAIRGADPVSYFTQSALVMGSPEHGLMWRGAEWRFSSAKNRAQFEADPEAFAPKFGGYCAYAASKGAIATTVPEAWTVFEGKLYLNYSDYVRGVWLQDVPGNIARANGFWPEILQS